MKKKTIYIIIGVVLTVVLLIYLLSRIPKREFNDFDFPSTLVVENFTDNEKADTISMVILNKLLGYDTMTVTIYPMPGIFEKDDKMEYFAFIQRVPFEEHRYLLFLQKDASVGRMTYVFPHELVHLKQFELGHLRTIGEYGYVWMGDTVRYVDVKYEDRPYEREAMAYGRILEKKLNTILYKPRK